MTIISMRSSSTFMVVFLLLVVVATLSSCHADTATTPSTTTPSTTTTTKKSLTLATLNPHLLAMEYAVRGAVVQQADAMVNAGHTNIVYTNIGNPQAVGQAFLSWPRQVMALCELPPTLGIDNPALTRLFPSDAVERARHILQALKGTTGAYTHSQGVYAFRQDVADFITKRDASSASHPDSIFLTNGASAAIQMILTALIANDSCGIMVPIPQYPLYSATIRALNGQAVGYALTEDKDWELNVEHELERAYNQAVAQGIRVRGLVLINPGNPTGQVLTPANVKDVVHFCIRHNIVLLSDEVYQENVYNKKKNAFYSCRKAVYEMNVADTVELVSFHSTSKGVFGECGRRGGYMELIGIDADVQDQLYKLASSNLCSSVSGQIMTSLLCRGPQPGDPSYESHCQEQKAIFESLRTKSLQVVEGLNSIPGISCRPAAGAMYCFVKVDGITDDTDYCVSLLEHTGICVVPASGFGQAPGRHGFRITFLPDNMPACVEAIREHHVLYMTRLKKRALSNEME